MDTLGFVFGISGMLFSTIAFIYATSALNKIKELEDRLNSIVPEEPKE